MTRLVFHLEEGLFHLRLPFLLVYPHSAVLLPPRKMVLHLLAVMPLASLMELISEVILSLFVEELSVSSSGGSAGLAARLPVARRVLC